jgi:hypothetical protein
MSVCVYLLRNRCLRVYHFEAWIYVRVYHLRHGCLCVYQLRNRRLRVYYFEAWMSACVYHLRQDVCVYSVCVILCVCRGLQTG